MVVGRPIDAFHKGDNDQKQTAPPNNAAAQQVGTEGCENMEGCVHVSLELDCQYSHSSSMRCIIVLTETVTRMDKGNEK